MGKLAEAGIFIDRKRSDIFYDGNDGRYINARIWDKELDAFAGEAKLNMENDSFLFYPNGGHSSPYADWAINKDFEEYIKRNLHTYMDRHPQPEMLKGVKAYNDMTQLAEDIKSEYENVPADLESVCVTAEIKGVPYNVPIEYMIQAAERAAEDAWNKHDPNPKMRIVTGEGSMGRSHSENIHLKDLECVSGNGRILYETREHSVDRFKRELEIENNRNNGTGRDDDE